MKMVRERMRGKNACVKTFYRGTQCRLGAFRKVWVAICIGVVFLMVSTVQAVPVLTLGFEHISNNSPLTGTPVGEAQMSVDIDDIGGGQVKFTFFNIGAVLSSITDIYFDDGTLLGIASIDNMSQPEVSFSLPASPGNLPGGNLASPPFVTTTNFSADSDPPVEGPNGNGVNPGEMVAIIFDLQGGGTVADVISELVGAQAGDLRIGIHVQGFSDGSSESFINVPEPATMMLLGLGAVGMVRKRRNA